MECAAVLRGCTARRSIERARRLLYRQRSSPGSAVATRHAGWGEDELPQLVLSRPERPRGRQQEVAPHPVEALVVAVAELGPMPLEVLMPVHQRGVVVRSGVVPVLDDELP